MNKKTIGIAGAVISAVYFGFLPFFVKTICVGGGTEMSASFYRFFWSLPFIFVYLKIKKVPIKISLKEFLEIAVISLFGYGGTGLLLFSSYRYIPSGMATTLHFMYPVFTILGAIVFLKKPVKLVKLVCAALCMIGLLLFYKADGGANILGVALAFLSSLTYAFYTLYLGNSKLKDMNTLKLIFYLNLVAAFMIFIATNIAGEFTYDLSFQAWFVAIAFAAATSFIGVFGYQIGVRYIGAESTTILSTFEPITSIVIGVLIYSEALTLKTIIGAAAILLAAVLVAKIKD